MVGRFIAGIAVGYDFVIAPIYAAEISPASSRGLLTSVPEVCYASSHWLDVCACLSRTIIDM